MTIVCVKPMPEGYRKISKKYRPGHPPPFQDIGPEGLTPEDYAIAAELFELLDPESQEWWGGAAFLKALKGRSETSVKTGGQR